VREREGGREEVRGGNIHKYMYIKRERERQRERERERERKRESKCCRERQN
jgi:hypothetical protein